MKITVDDREMFLVPDNEANEDGVIMPQCIGINVRESTTARGRLKVALTFECPNCDKPHALPTGSVQLGPINVPITEFRMESN